MKIFPFIALALATLLPARENDSPPKNGKNESAPETTPEKTQKKTAPAIKQLNDNEFQIGKVHLDKGTREITFPAHINMDKGLLEYAIVHINGKIHEALLSTEIKASNLNIAFKLLRYPESNELFEIVDEDYRPTGKFPDTPQTTRDGARIDIKLTWEKAGKETTLPLNHLIYHTTLERHMPGGPWLYTGSYLLEDKFKADLSGDITAIFLSQPAMINYPGNDRISDEVWLVNEKTAPAAGTPVTVAISPYEIPQEKNHENNTKKTPSETLKK